MFCPSFKHPLFSSYPYSVPFVEAFLSLSLTFDGIAFLVILAVTFSSSQSYNFMPVMKIIKRDGVMYFFVLFSSSLVWLVLLLRARVMSFSFGIFIFF